MKYKSKYVSGAKGFTLIELLVVIAIIGLLSSVIVAPIQSARKKARNAQRVSSLDSLKTALAIYFDDNGAYPNSSVAWRSQCTTWGGYANNLVIPGLVPNYLPRMPTDPLNTTPGSSNDYCYLYISDGVQYKILLYQVQETTAPSAYADSARGGGIYWAICDGALFCTY